MDPETLNKLLNPPNRPLTFEEIMRWDEEAIKKRDWAQWCIATVWLCDFMIKEAQDLRGDDEDSTRRMRVRNVNAFARTRQEAIRLLENQYFARAS